jgi:hypothetical protein
VLLSCCIETETHKVANATIDGSSELNAHTTNSWSESHFFSESECPSGSLNKVSQFACCQCVNITRGVTTKYTTMSK